MSLIFLFKMIYFLLINGADILRLSNCGIFVVVLGMVVAVVVAVAVFWQVKPARIHEGTGAWSNYWAFSGCPVTQVSWPLISSASELEASGTWLLFPQNRSPTSPPTPPHPDPISSPWFGLPGQWLNWQLSHLSSCTFPLLARVKKSLSSLPKSSRPRSFRLLQLVTCLMPSLTSPCQTVGIGNVSEHW